MKSQTYGPFWLSMFAPLAAGVATLMFIIPKFFYERHKERNATDDELVAPAERGIIFGSKDAGGVKDKFFRRICRCARCSKPLSNAEKSEWIVEQLAEKERHFDPFLRLAAVLVFVLYSLFPSLTDNAISIFRCSRLIEGRRYLVSDYTVICYTGWHIAAICFGSFFTALYALGIPIGTFALLFTWRTQIKNGGVRVSNSLGFLFSGYSTTRGVMVMSWYVHCASSLARARPSLRATPTAELTPPLLICVYCREVIVMLRKLAITLISIFDVSATIEILMAIVLLIFVLLANVNVRPFQELWLNLLEEMSILVLILTQTMSLIYLDLDVMAKYVGKTSNHAALEATTTVILLALNALAYVALGGALCVAIARHYGPRFGCCLDGSPGGKCAVTLLDEEWIEGVRLRHDEVRLVWLDKDGAIVPKPLLSCVMWIDEASSRIEIPWANPEFVPPPLGKLPMLCDATGNEELEGFFSAWRSQETFAIVPLASTFRPQSEWRNSRTGATMLINPFRGAPTQTLLPPHRAALELSATTTSTTLSTTVPNPVSSVRQQEELLEEGGEGGEGGEEEEEEGGGGALAIAAAPAAAPALAHPEQDMIRRVGRRRSIV